MNENIYSICDSGMKSFVNREKVWKGQGQKCNKSIIETCKTLYVADSLSRPLKFSLLEGSDPFSFNYVSWKLVSLCNWLHTLLPFIPTHAVRVCLIWHNVWSVRHKTIFGRETSFSPKCRTHFISTCVSALITYMHDTSCDSAKTTIMTSKIQSLV